MVKIIDRRKQSMGGNDKRATSRITSIAVHYSATKEGSTSAFENYWKSTRKWISGGYHEVVLLNGDVELNYNADTISNGVYGHNSNIYNICYVGDGKPNTKQLKSLKERVSYNRKRFNVSVVNVKGHREFSGQSTACPALDMNGFRKSLSDTNTSQSNTSKPSTTKPKPSTGNLGLVDYMNSQKMDSSYNNRKKLAAQYNISNYKGTAAQNTTLLARIRGGKPATLPNKSITANLEVDGYLGRLSIMALQRYFETTVDGVISSPSMVIKALQRFLGVKADGYLGKITITAMQRKFNMKHVDGVISKSSLVIKELQRRLNRGKL